MDLATEFACALSTITSALASFAAVVEKADKRFVGLEELEEKLNHWRSELDRREDHLAKRELWVQKREKAVAQEEKWRTRERQSDAIFPDKIKVNTGHSKSNSCAHPQRENIPPHSEDLEDLSNMITIPLAIPLPTSPGRLLPQEALSAITSWLPKKQFSQIYKASKNGFSSRSYHQTIDHKGPTLTVIRSAEGFVFGGYSPLSWRSDNKYYSHPDTFLFTLTNPHFIPPSRFPLRPGDPLAICCRSSCCAVFGGGYDLCLGSNSNIKDHMSYSKFPCSYIDPFGKGGSTFTGSPTFTTSEVEVYLVL